MKRPRFKNMPEAFRREYRRILSRKISNRIMLTYVALAALPLVIVSVILVQLTRNTVQTYIFERNMETARRAGKEIALFIKDPLTILQTTALSRDVADMDRFSQSTLINVIKDRNPIFRNIFVLNDSGAVTATTRFGEETRNYSNTPFFKTGILGKEFISEVYFTSSRFPLLSIAEPITKYNQVVGVLVAEIDLKNIWTLVDNITIGKTGFAFLLSAEGRVIAHQDKAKVLEKQDYSSHSFFRELQAGRQGIQTEIIENEEVLLVYEPIPRLGWGIVVQQNQAEAFTLARQMQIRIILFAVVTILIAIFIGYLGVKRITRPLLHLVTGVREYGKGNLKHRIEMETLDELAELAQEFNSMADSLLKNQKKLQRMERLAALSRFAALVSHEVRNPLNSMNINMQILKRIINRPDVDPAKKNKYLDVISSEIIRINDMVTNFLAIARPPELTPVRTDVHRALDEVLLMQEARAHSEGIHIEKEYCSQPASGMFDYNQLKQVFHNLIINAFEAMPDGGNLRVSTRVISKPPESENPRRWVQIELKDSGGGIPKEILHEVFEFYYTTKRAGTGLGLAIAKQIIEAHKGIVYIHSVEGEGASVFIELPIDYLVEEN